MKEARDEKEILKTLKKTTCELLEKNNSTCAHISQIDLSISKQTENAALKEERNKFAKIAKDYNEQINKNYRAIVELEKKVNNRFVDPNSPSMNKILHEWEEKPKFILR